MPSLIDLTGKTFGLLTVMYFAGRNQHGQRTYRALCSCGSSVVAVSGNLTSGNTTSCGCKRTESLKARNSATHHMSRTPTWNSWDSMLKRCNGTNSHAAHNYIGRGITVCERWLRFENFFSDMGLRPDGKTLDRINNDGNYEPSNCRWATKKQQALNTRRQSR